MLSQRHQELGYSELKIVQWGYSKVFQTVLKTKLGCVTTALSFSFKQTQKKDCLRKELSVSHATQAPQHLSPPVTTALNTSDKSMASG